MGTAILKKGKILVLVGAIAIWASGCSSSLTPSNLNATPSGSTAAAGTLSITPLTPSVAPGGSIAFTASGGTAPYTYLISAGTGTFTSNTFVAPGYVETDDVVIYDSAGLSAATVVTVSNGSPSSVSTSAGTLVISPLNSTVSAGASVVFSASGGTGPYSFTIFSGSGQFLNSGNIFTAPILTETDTVQVTDTSSGAVVQTTIKVTGVNALGYAYMTPTIHSDTGIACALGYTQAYQFADCNGGKCYGNINLCVGPANATAGSQIITGMEVLGLGGHTVNGPGCSSGYTDISMGQLADCFGGKCQGNLNMCVQFTASAPSLNPLVAIQDPGQYVGCPLTWQTAGAVGTSCSTKTFLWSSTSQCKTADYFCTQYAY